MVVSHIFYFHPYLGKISNLTNIFQMGWFNHQPVSHLMRENIFCLEQLGDVEVDVLVSPEADPSQARVVHVLGKTMTR